MSIDPERLIGIPIVYAQRLLDAFWYSQWVTRHAAENTVCSRNCDDTWADFTGHAADCSFVEEWTEMAEVRALLGEERMPLIRT